MLCTIEDLQDQVGLLLLYKYAKANKMQSTYQKVLNISKNMQSKSTWSGNVPKSSCSGMLLSSNSTNSEWYLDAEFTKPSKKEKDKK